MYDQINAFFEMSAAVMVWSNVASLLRDRRVAGVNLWASAWTVLWGVSSLFYYVSLQHWWSLCGNLGILTANATWLGLALKYRRK